MSKINSILTAFIMVPAIIFAQEAADKVATVVQEMPVQDFLAMLAQSLGGLKGASALAIAGVVVQVLMAFFKTKMASFAGKYKLLIVYGLSVVFGVISLKISGLSLLASIVHSQTLAAGSVFLHQGYVQFFKKEDDI